MSDGNTEGLRPFPAALGSTTTTNLIFYVCISCKQRLPVMPGLLLGAQAVQAVQLLNTAGSSLSSLPDAPPG